MKLNPSRILKYRDTDGVWIEPDKETYFEQSEKGTYILYVRKVDDAEYRRVDIYWVREIIWDMAYEDKKEQEEEAERAEVVREVSGEIQEGVSDDQIKL